ncbi:conserved hypothetical protein [Staphylothermus marinus F1]|uniref:Uncharacterized protein n=1 Tax=Staphylothermus marinus (strain ATCC 43588 / DSM 3639 / JCM 9404 / F1) TaxID=399550 RepID=A3DLC6_STAMF|nr:hypothetical protein [Staphylothermus marinus]ABN69436.1 conserved hypothetical protein [Staphylothermus marinus F1]
MAELKLLIKPDNTFLTQIIYEGLLLLLQHNLDQSSFHYNKIILPSYSLRKLFENVIRDKSLRDEFVSVRTAFVGNDKKYDLPGQILKSVGVPLKGKSGITYIGQLLEVLINNYTKLPDLRDSSLIYKRTSNSLIIGSALQDVVSAPQIFKVDRYTGFTTADLNTTYNRYGVKGEPFWVLIGLLGIASSYVVQYREPKSGSKVSKISYYYLFFSPDEMLEMLASRNPKYLYNLMTLKRIVVTKLRELINSNLPSEIIILSLMLDTNIMAELAKNEIDHLFLQLYRVVNEGNTYKIYNTTLLNLYSTPYYLDVLEKITGSSDKSENLLSILNKMVQPNSPLIWSINSMDKKNKDPDADHAFRALMELYRFIVYGDPRGFYGFLRELTNAKTILEGEKNEKYKNRARYYSRRLTEISKTL